ncbi:IclR family transcriptional regulator [Paenarthrobacter sp. JL.01a]|uniref:IclR family transcriptional regulator n=1 Tax=Paenarthrobacter sp. JL.01a TaxID=2979324 RepID=UPI0021C69054|nr:IclR family transcriptional regulator [Paenarthrobacter sp. JL.01a]UXM91591.1 IclR family transcriptional regulator [Paenarthrobacter sp. JL.01a]
MSDTLQSVQQALRILDSLQRKPELGITEVANELGCAMSTAHRLVTTLAEAGYVQRSTAGRKYRLGPAMLGANDAAAIEHCIEKAQPYMESLRDLSGETVQLAILQKSSIRFVAGVESRNIMRVTSRVGTLMPAHATASGKLLLSLREDAELARLYQDGLGEPLTTAGKTSVARFLEEVHRVREEGFGQSLNEVEMGVAALAVAVNRPKGRVLCALTVSGPSSRFGADDPAGDPIRAALLKELRIHADRISDGLTF